MKGIVFNLLEEFISTEWGDERYEATVSGVTLETKQVFVGPGTYPDADLFKLVANATRLAGLEPSQFLHDFGRYCFPALAGKFPRFVRDHTHLKSFLMTLDSVIHIEVRKIFRDATPPALTFEDLGPGRLVLRYVSERRLCALMTGLMDGAAAYYGEPITYTQRACMKEGATSCEFELFIQTKSEAEP
jgi:hypothetical protein